MVMYPQFNCILLVMLTTISVTQATFKVSVYSMYEEGETIIGKTGTKRTTKTNIQCSMMCLKTEKCKSYKYRETRQGNCLLINQNSTDEEGQIVKQDATSVIYKKDPCFENKCQNLGKCINIDHEYKCDCVDGYYGSLCEEQDDCYPNNNCSNGGTCIDQDGNYTCSCPPFWTGIYCQSCKLKLSNVSWTSPIGWNGTCPVLYLSFDNIGDLVINGQNDYVINVVSGKVNKALVVDRTRNQWVDLGIHTEACMTQPETCGAAGGSIALWLNLIQCPDWAGFISSHDSGTGFALYCKEDGQKHVRYVVHTQNGTYQAYAPKLSGWTHVVLSYIQLNNTEGIKIFYNGAKMSADFSKWNVSLPSGDSRIMVGRRRTDRDNGYASVKID